MNEKLLPAGDLTKPAATDEEAINRIDNCFALAGEWIGIQDWQRVKKLLTTRSHVGEFDGNEQLHAKDVIDRLWMLAKLYARDADTPKAMREAAVLLNRVLQRASAASTTAAIAEKEVLPSNVVAEVKRVSAKVMDASLLEEDLFNLARVAMRTASALSATPRSNDAQLEAVARTAARSARSMAIEDCAKIIDRKGQALTDEYCHGDAGPDGYTWTNKEAEWQVILLGELADEMRAADGTTKAGG